MVFVNTLFLMFMTHLINLALAGMEPTQYILDFPLGNNHLNISINLTHPEMNYWLLIGDWGAGTNTMRKVQTEIANKMLSYYNQQKALGYNLLGVITAGDNFYYDGIECDPQKYHLKWSGIYGELATDYHWLAIMGNHDYGDNDKDAICAWVNPQYVDPSTNIPYAAHQLDKDKKGCNPDNYFLPDFGYYYTINELNFELISLDENASDCPVGIGGQTEKTWKICGNSTVGCDYLQKIQKASENMMIQRAKISNNSNFLIVNHYPDNGKYLLGDFGRSRNTTLLNNDTVWSMYGHVHIQRCDAYDHNGTCIYINNGGGSGCCGEETLRGFFVIGFDENKNMIQPLRIDDPILSCQYPCGAFDDVDNEEIVKNEIIECCNTAKQFSNEYFSVDCNSLTVNYTQC